MTLTTQSFSHWWRPPRKTGDREEERRVTFLELFYDLVYVVVIAEIGHFLATHIDVQGVLEAAFLFVLVWLGWLNGSMYHDLHGHNDVRTRVFTFAQMFTVVAMAVFAHSAFQEGAVGFAVSFSAYQLILGYLWWQTGVHDPDHRPLSLPYASTLIVSAALFGGSAFVPENLRMILWGIGLLLTVTVPVAVFMVRPSDPQVAAEHERSLRMSSSAVERFDLFTIIVLGEVIVGVVRGVAGHHQLEWTVGATAALGMLIAIGLWWLYFDFVSHRIPLTGRTTTFGWIYLHLFTTMGIVAAGAAVLNVVEHAGVALLAEVRWLLVVSIALALASIALSMTTLQLREEHRSLYCTAVRITLISAVAIMGLGFSGLATIPLLLALNLLMLVPVLWGLRVSIMVFGTEEIVVA